jgi:hypothetical protein
MNRSTLTHVHAAGCDAPIAHLSKHACFVGRVGALAVFLGVGSALAVPGVAAADTGGGTGSESTSSSSSSTGSDGGTSDPGRDTSSASDSKSTDSAADSTTDSAEESPNEGEPDVEDLDDLDDLDQPDIEDVQDIEDIDLDDLDDIDDIEDIDQPEDEDFTDLDESDVTVAEADQRSEGRSTEFVSSNADVIPTGILATDNSEEPAEDIDTDEIAPQPDPVSYTPEPAADIITIVSTDPASAPAPTAITVTTAVMTTSTATLPGADHSPTAPVAYSLVGVLLASARRYEEQAWDSSATAQSTTTALSNNISLLLPTVSAAPDRTVLQYTFAALGESFKTIIRNPLRAIQNPIETGLYVVNTIIRGLMTDMGLIAANPLATRDAIATQREAARLVATPEVKAAKKAAVDFLLSTALATTSPGAEANRAIVTKAVDEYAMALALGAVVTETPANPRISTVAFLGSRYGLDNPDNAYRGFTIDGGSTYVITGNTKSAAFISFQVVNGIYGENGQTPSSGAVLDSTQLQTDENGNFTITLGPEPANGQVNYIQLTPDSKQVIIRDTLTDWSQVPATLSVKRVAGPPLPPPPTFEEKTQRLATLIVTGAPYWHGFSNAYRQMPANTLTPAIPTPGGLVGQSSALGHFSLTEEQALVVTIRPFGADYVGFQVGTDWFTSIDYANHTSSMTTDQARPNADGSVTYVVSLKDPGVANWIDPAGHPTGLLQVRWQGLQAGVMPPGYTPTVQLVSFDELSTVLPAETEMVTERQRRAQIAQRRAQLRERYAGIPAHLVPFDLQTFQPLF